PLHSTALGKVLCAYDPVAHSEVAESDREAFTPSTVTTLPDLEGVLDLTRARG
ncbi:IclR family transcriptional regulator C-terminal domain-containing protein, partial [Streptomyces alboverticillatus]